MSRSRPAPSRSEGDASPGSPLLVEGAASLREISFAVLDLETTGYSPRSGWDREGRFRPAAEITDVGIVRMRGAVIQGTFESLCAIGGTVPAAIQRLTGITPALLAGAPSWEQVALGLQDHLEGRVWVAHLARFDGAFLHACLPEGLWRRHVLICTCKLAKVLVPEAPSRSLGNLCAHLGIVNRRAHRALPDAEAAAELLQHLLARAEAAGMDAEAFLRAGRVEWKGFRS